MQIKRRHLMALGAVALALPGTAATAGFPAKPIRMVVPFAAGGTSDVVARLLAQMLGDELKTQVIVDNRPGAGGLIAIDAVLKAPADGYTLLLGSNSVTLLPLMRKNLPYDPAALQPLARVRAGPTYIAANAALPFHDMAGLVAYAKAHPGQLRYASGGNGTILHLIGEWIKQRTGTDLVHVPYKSISQAVIDASGGQLDLVLAGPTDLAPGLSTGQLRMIVVSGERRSSLMPNVRTMVESGYPGFVTVNWNGVFVQRGTPADVAALLADSIARVAGSAEFLRRGMSVDIEEGNVLRTAAFEQFLAEETDRYRQVIERSKIDFNT